MKKLLVVCGLLVATRLASAQTFTTTLAGSRELGGGDSNGSGVAVISFNGTTVSYYLWVKASTGLSSAHIHTGGAGANGGIVVDLGALSVSSPVSGVFVAHGSVSTTTNIANAITGAPTSYYVNIHNASFPNGAMRGQLLGDGAASQAFVTTLIGSREPAGGDPSAAGYAAIVLDGTSVYYWITAGSLAGPTAAHLHQGAAGVNGGIAVDLNATFSGSVATGRAVSSSATVGSILASPDGFYVNVHSGAFPVGAMRGQLRASESDLHVPVVAHNHGLNNAFFKTDVRILSLTDEAAGVFVEFYPHDAAGGTGPAATSPVSVSAGGCAVLDDVADLLFSASDRGALRILSTFPIRAVARNYNDQRANSAGTFGQFEQGLGPESKLTSGALLLNSNRPAGDLQDFRTNVGYFNASPNDVTVTYNVRLPDGSLVGTPSSVVVPAWANEQGLFFQTIPGIPAEQQTLANFYITFSATRPIFVFSSVVDNVSGDGLHQPASPVPASLTAPAVS
jgi:hypothetical protein